MSLHRPITIKTKDPLVRQVFERLNQSPYTIEDLADAVGINKSTLSTWASGRTRNPSAANLQAAFNFLGFKLVVRPMSDPEPSGFTLY